MQEYARMGEAGIFAPDERVELLEGDIVPVSPQDPRPASRVAALTALLVRCFGDDHEIRVQLPLTLGTHSEPEPDFALVPFEVATQAGRHPETADLVIEVANTSISFDRDEKASLYAKAGIPDYWILNLNAHRLEVRRKPVEDPTGAYGHGYADLSVWTPGQEVAPGFAPGIAFEVGRLLGPAEDFREEAEL